MFETLELTRMAQRLAAHAGARMGVIAQNIANADTPGYRARDIGAFSQSMVGAPLQLLSSRPGHMTAPEGARALPVFTTTGGEAPNGNSVSLEGEMVKAAEARQEHEMALAIYRSTSGVIRAALGRS